MKFGIGYCYWSKDWEGNDYPQYIERARKCGFDVLEIFFSRILTMDEKEIQDIKSACKMYNVELYALGGFDSTYDISQMDNDLRKKAVAKCIELLAAIERLDIHNFSGINYGEWCNFKNPDKKPKLFEQSAKSLKEIGHVAEEKGIRWNMEVVNRFESCMLNTAKEARLLAEMSESPAIHILLDIFHGMIEEDDLAGAILTAGDKLGHYHMGSNNRRLPRPCFLPWQDVCDALKKIKYDKCISFEPLVQAGGTVAKDGGSIWRPMLPEGITEDRMDEELIQARKYIEAMLL